MASKIWLCITSLLIIGWNHPVLSQDSIEKNSPLNPHLEADYITGPGFGYSSSLGRFSGFFPLQQTPGRDLLFLTGRLHFSPKDDLVSSSLILAMRRLQNQAIWGGYMAYDIRNTGSHHFHQLGLGFEQLSEVWDWRLNGYIPLGKTRQLVDENIVNQVSYSNPQFENHFLSVFRNQQRRIKQSWQSALTGFELETGGKLTNLGREGSLRGYVGVYHYGGEGVSSFWGWKGRLEANPNANYRLGLTLSQDEKFGTNLVLSVGVRLGGINPQKRSSPGSSQGSIVARLAEPIARNSLVAVAEQREVKLIESSDRIFLTNPQTNQPWRFRHVNLGIGMGNGTAENPTGTLQAALDLAQTHDIVYVRSGNNSPIPGFTIPDGVQALSTGPNQVIPTLEIPQLQLPESNSGAFPQITETVMMGNQTTLSGFRVSTSIGPGILANNVQNINLHNNQISNTAESGISLQNVTQSVSILNNTINATKSDGIFLVNNEGQIELSVAGNTIRENAQGLSLNFNGNAGGKFNFQANEISNNQLSGIDIAANDNNVITVNLANNQINSNQLSGLSITISENSKATFLVDNHSQFNNNQQNGIYGKINDSATFELSLRNATINGNTMDGVYLETSNDAKARIIIFDKTELNGNQGIGFNIFAFDAAKTFINLQDNFLTNSVNEDLFGSTFDSGEICLKATGNTINKLSLNDSIGGTISIEEDIMAQNIISNTNLNTTTPVAAGTCGF